MYTNELAEKLKEHAGEKWRPSNGTEGDIFIYSWCRKCKKDVNNDCPILAATMAFDASDELYPQEWQYGDDGQPKCSAYDRI